MDGAGVRSIVREMNSVKRFFSVVFLAAISSASAIADAPQQREAAESDKAFSPLFQAGAYELSLSSGVLFSPFGATHNRPTINYTLSELQFGYMVTDVEEHGWLRGNFEITGAAFGSGIFLGEGSYIIGCTTWLRYNLVPVKGRFSGYAQAGGGVVATDIDKGIVGQTFNFNLDLALGVRYFISPRISLNLEYRYQHISNANLGRKNVGINAHGPILGISYFF
jgi:opacity protein-like surface antigen